jgi:long-subunit acyl-CoA synthetase (AMP-forming)
MMNNLILYTSGSTDEPKEVCHTHETVNAMLKRSIDELGLTSHDIVLNTFPSNVIAYYAITALPAIEVGATLITLNFDPYQYIKAFNQYRPTVIALIPRHIEVLQSTKGFQDLDMSCVRYMIMGSQHVPQEMIDMLLSKGVQLIGNWYGSTENPPPVMVAYNGTQFDFEKTFGYAISFDQRGLCYVNGVQSGDVFDLSTKKYSHRLKNATNSTWKS